MMYSFGRAITAFPLINLLCGLSVEGVENIPEKGGLILASNHASYLDPLALGAACPRKISYMAKEELFRIPLFGWMIRSVGAFPVKRHAADISALKEALRRLKNGEVIALFPEGARRNQEDTAGEPEAGVGFLAQKSGVPVIPALIKGTEKALPKGARFIRPTPVRVRFGRSIIAEKGMPYQECARLIMEGIRLLEK